MLFETSLATTVSDPITIPTHLFEDNSINARITISATASVTVEGQEEDNSWVFLTPSPVTNGAGATNSILLPLAKALRVSVAGNTGDVQFDIPRVTNLIEQIISGFPDRFNPPSTPNDQGSSTPPNNVLLGSLLGAIVVSNIEMTTDTIVVTITAPEEYAGVYNIPVDPEDSPAAQNILAPEIVGPLEVDTLLTLKGGIWVVDTNRYTVVGSETPPLSRTLIRNGEEFVQDAILNPQYTSQAFDVNQELTLVETIDAPGGGEPFSVVSTPFLITAPESISSVTFTDQRLTNVGGTMVIPEDVAGFSFIIGMTIQPNVSAQQDLLFNTQNPGINTNLKSEGKFGARLIPTGASTQPAESTTFNSIPTATPTPLFFMGSADINRHGNNEWWLIRAAFNGTTISVARTNSNIPTVGFDLRTLSFGGTGANAFAGTVDFIWVAPLPFRTDVLQSAFLTPDETAPEGFRRKFIPANGAMTVDGTSVDPLVFIAGTQFDQFEITPGVWAVPNRGTAGGAMQIIGGPFA